LPDGLSFVNMTTFQTRRFRFGTDLRAKMLFSPNSATLAVFFENRGIELWDVATAKKRLGDFEQLQNWRWDEAFQWESTFLFASFSSDSNLFALAGKAPQGHKLALWNVPSSTLLWIKDRNHPRYQLNFFTSDSQWLVADTGNRIEVLDTRTGQRRHFFMG